MRHWHIIKYCKQNKGPVWKLHSASNTRIIFHWPIPCQNRCKTRVFTLANAILISDWLDNNRHTASIEWFIGNGEKTGRPGFCRQPCRTVLSDLRHQKENQQNKRHLEENRTENKQPPPPIIIKIQIRKGGSVAFGGEELEDVEQFSYIGNVINKIGGTDGDIYARICKARQAFAMLKQVWKSNVLSENIKIWILNTNVKSVLYYGCDTRKVKAGLQHQIKIFINKCLRHL